MGQDEMYEGYMVVVDTETTSKYPESARVLEIAGVAYCGGRRLGVFCSLVRAKKEDLNGAEEALRVNGIEPNELLVAPEMEAVKKAWSSFLEQFPDARITAFNSGYDRGVLEVGGWRALPWDKCLMLASMDVMGAAGALQERFNGSWKWPRLSEAADFFKVKQAGRHRALGDAATAARIMLAIKNRDGAWKED
jgi:DNA polymerase III epsilon subunit-like protein